MCGRNAVAAALLACAVAVPPHLDRTCAHLEPRPPAQPPSPRCARCRALAALERFQASPAFAPLLDAAIRGANAAYASRSGLLVSSREDAGERTPFPTARAATSVSARRRDAAAAFRASSLLRDDVPVCPYGRRGAVGWVFRASSSPWRNGSGFPMDCGCHYGGSRVFLDKDGGAHTPCAGGAAKRVRGALESCERGGDGSAARRVGRALVCHVSGWTSVLDAHRDLAAEARGLNGSACAAELAFRLDHNQVSFATDAGDQAVAAVFYATGTSDDAGGHVAALALALELRDALGPELRRAGGTPGAWSADLAASNATPPVVALGPACDCGYGAAACDGRGVVAARPSRWPADDCARCCGG